MSLSALRQRPAWGALERHYQKIRDWHLRQLFADDRERSERIAVEAVGSISTIPGSRTRP
jgi:glucose-6-phosphate isomerase